MDYQCSVSDDCCAIRILEMKSLLAIYFPIAAFFYQIKETDGDEIDNIVRHLGYLNETNDSVSLTYTFSLASLIGSINTERFYTYRGEGGLHNFRAVIRFSIRHQDRWQLPNVIRPSLGSSFPTLFPSHLIRSSSFARCRTVSKAYCWLTTFDICSRLAGGKSSCAQSRRASRDWRNF